MKQYKKPTMVKLGNLSAIKGAAVFGSMDTIHGHFH
jgi:hypothetical protein